MLRALLGITLVLTPSAAGTAQSRWPNPDSSQLSIPSSPALPQSAACRRTAPVVTADSIGPLNTRLSVAEIKQRCAGAQYGWLWAEGIPSAAALVRLGEGELL